MKTKLLGVLAATGLTMSLGCANNCCKDSGEMTVAMKDLPAAVRATLDRETAGGKVTEVEKEVKNGKTVYSADAEVGGKSWDITIAEDGKLISKELEKPGESEKKPEKK